MKEIKFDRHARRRMKWRRISKEEIIAAILQPDKKEFSFKRRINVYKETSGKILKVTYRESKENIFVITAVLKQQKSKD